MAISFSEFMQRCLYDPRNGYYASGRVSFGHGDERHFWTYPQRLQPFFGQMVAEAALSMFEALGDIPPDAPVTILELGAGNGDLAGDALDWIVAHADEPRWKPWADRVVYVVGEFSAALRERQRTRLQTHIEAGRAQVREVDAGALSWEGPFYGMVVANELIDAFPCERLVVHGVDSDGVIADRTHVSLQDDISGDNVDFETLWDSQDLTVVPHLVPLREGWQGPDGIEAVPPALLGYLDTLRPLVRDLASADLLPVELMWAPRLPTFVEGLATITSGPNRRGVVLLIDYGGPSRHVLDPRAAAPHLRVYGPDGDRAHKDAVYKDPGEYDMTWDVDFSDVARLAAEHGLQTLWFGHQSKLEQPPIDLWAKENQPFLIQGRREEGELNEMDALMKAYELVARFRGAGGFRMIALGPEGVQMPARFGESDPVADDGWKTLALDVPEAALEEALETLGLAAVAPYLKPCGDIVTDLSDRREYNRRQDVLALLDDKGWLVQTLEGTAE